MKTFHPTTNVTASLALFVVILASTLTGLSGLSELEWQPEPMRAPTTEVVASKPVYVNQSVAENLKMVFAVGREVGHPETLQAILLKETGGNSATMIGNRASPVGKRSYGLMQVQVVAARSVLQRVPKVRARYFPNRAYSTILDEEVIALLLTNNEANIRIAAHHFQLYFNLLDGDWDKTVAAYNAGIGGVENIPEPSEFQYVVDVKDKIESVIRPFNRKHGLS